MKYFYKKIVMLTLLLTSFTLLLTACNKEDNTQTNETSSIAVENEKNNIPTLFIHGYKGTKNSFGKMIKRLEKEGYSENELVLEVTSEGEIEAEGELSKKNNNPTVQIIFQNNQSDEWTQGGWIKKCLTYLKDNYEVEKVNIVAHSMGGASTFRFLISYGEESLPKINKFVAIGTPFNDFVELQSGETLDSVIENGPKLKSGRYLDYEKGVSKIQREMEVLVIAGDVEDGSLGDEAVPMVDALSVVSLFRSNGNTVDYQEYYGEVAQHSMLHENEEVDKRVGDFLWK